MARPSAKKISRSTPSKTARPRFRDLDPFEIEELLARNYVARLAYTLHDRVDIEPIHYVLGDGWLYVRTSPGTKVSTLAHHQWVALEVDEIDGLFSWRSVVVHGTVHRADLVGSPEEQRSRDRAIRSLRRLIPETLAEDDPVPFRTVVMRISLGEVRGRAAYLPKPRAPRSATKRKP
ncbi:MAG: pyridoxamine 5'-phosphate oxidase family protein [Gemmatimonadota bacterium]|nr:pyridoxamine 5'-phosphate oxidase family protein [Gemmatimonadota bacterium]